MFRRRHPSSLAFLWLLLALLPVRGWANLTMHLPTQDSAAVAPCHASQPLAADVAAEAPDATQPCTLCDVCHGVMLLGVDMAQRSERCAQSLPSARAALAVATDPEALFRPPRR